jgi:hypothetical protein
MFVRRRLKPFFDRMFKEGSEIAKDHFSLRQISRQELAPKPLEGAEPLLATIHGWPRFMLSKSAKPHAPQPYSNLKLIVYAQGHMGFNSSSNPFNSTGICTG